MLVSNNHAVSGYILLTVLLLAVNNIGRVLFYVVVVPTTMHGVFFRKNASFVEHVREMGLANMPQLGVTYETHHAFDIGELIETIRSTTLKQKLTRLRSIFTG